MARCGYCKTAILFGGVRDGNERYCNARCHENSFILKVASQVPQATVANEVALVHRGKCAKCGGPGPVDVHRVYRVWSLVVLTTTSHFSVVACRSCARKSQFGGLMYSFFLGWWGMWGLIFTPLQITRNIIGMCGGPDPSRPSPDLDNFVRTTMGIQMIQQQQQSSPPGGPPVIAR